MSLVQISIGYYFISNTIFVALLIAAILSLRKRSESESMNFLIRDTLPALAPPISILAPAYNEQETIVDSVRSFLLLEYPSVEILVINDGSKDETMVRLIQAFTLVKETTDVTPRLSQTEIRGVYRSHLHPNLIVIDKENGGKADALNIGLDFATHEIFCAVDSDSLLEPDALKRVAMPFVEDPDRVIASGGTVRIANGATVRFGRVESIDLSKNWLVLMQVVEYTRAFLCGRIGWNALNSTLVISGAFGLFNRRAVQAVGGYLTGSIGEDMELVLRLHRYHRTAGKDYRIIFVPDPVCWTEAPANLSSLEKQRDRWQRGLADSLFAHRALLFNPRFGALGLIAMPYFVFVELLGPVIEVLSLIYVGYLISVGSLDATSAKLFFIASLLYGALLSMAAVLIEEIYFSKYSHVRQLALLLGVCMFESIGYRQLSTLWRLKGLYRYAKGDHTWGHLKRAGFKKV